MPSKPKAGYPTANIAKHNVLPVTRFNPATYNGVTRVTSGEGVLNHPLNRETGTRQSKHSTDNATNLS